jgi:hypothetical protein
MYGYEAGFRVAPALRFGLHGMTGVGFELVARDLIRSFGAPSPEGKGEMIEGGAGLHASPLEKLSRSD